MTAPYVPARRAGDWLVLSGQIGLGPDGMADTFDAQLHQAIRIAAQRQRWNMSFDDRAVGDQGDAWL